MATVDGDTAGSIVAVGMHYGRNASLGINFVYGILAKQALGTVMRGSYNTFLAQNCTLVLVNPTATARNVSVSMTRFDGTAVITNQVINVPAFGTDSSDLCVNDVEDNYGVVSVQPDAVNSLVAHVIRQGASNAYRFPTPVRQ